MRRFNSIAGLFLLFGALISSANAAGLTGDRTAFQRLEVSNAGTSSVSGVSVLYGQIQLILGHAREKFPAGRPDFYAFSQGLDSPVAGVTKAHWVTDDDGVAHEAIIPTGGLIRERGVFYGFRFWIVDAHVDVYLVEKIPSPGHALNLKYTKVYTSA